MKHITLVFICCLAATLATTFARKIPDIARPHPDPTPPPGYEPAIQDDRCKNVASSKFLPHESDCSSFYECKNGLRYTRNCPSGLNYDFVNQVSNFFYAKFLIE